MCSARFLKIIKTDKPNHLMRQILFITSLLLFCNSSVYGQETDRNLSISISSYFGPVLSSHQNSTGFKEVVSSNAGIQVLTEYRFGKKLGIGSGLAIEWLRFRQNRKIFVAFSNAETFYEKTIGYRSFSLPVTLNYKLSETGRFFFGLNLMFAHWNSVENSIDQVGSGLVSVSSIDDSLNEDSQFIPEATIGIKGGLSKRLSLGLQGWFSLSSIDAGDTSLEGSIDEERLEYRWIRLAVFLEYRFY